MSGYAADRWIGKLFDASKPLAKPQALATSAKTSLPIRFCSGLVGAYLIIYRAEHPPIEIVAVTQGSRDIPAFLIRRVRS